MFECVTRAVILDKEPIGDYDGLLTLYTENFGKVSVKAKSIRKITSKLSAHTEPGTLLHLRLVGKNPFLKVKGSFWLVDGLKKKNLFTDFMFLEIVKNLTVEFHADRDLWRFLLEGKADRTALFTLLGFHPRDELVMNDGVV